MAQRTPGGLRLCSPSLGAGYRAKVASGKALNCGQEEPSLNPPPASPLRDLEHVPSLWSHSLTVKPGWILWLRLVRLVACWLTTLSSAHVHTHMNGCCCYCCNNSYYYLILTIL